MKKISKFAVAMCAVGLVGGMASSVLAHEAGDLLVRVGAATVFTNTDSEPVTGLPDGVNNATLDVDNNTQLGLTATYLFADNLGVGLLAATPFSHTATGEGDIAGVTIGKAKQLPPTLTAQYHFSDKDSTFNPYVGVGFNYTIFFDEEVSQDLIGILNTLPTIAGLGGINSVDMDIDNSFGIAVEAGMDIKIAENWYFNAAVWWIDLGTTATLTTDLGTTHKCDVDLDPWVLNVAIAYKF